MVRPIRLQLSRKSGFNLQAHSLAMNGLEAVKVDRSTKFGNPFAYDDKREAVAMFRSALPELVFFQIGEANVLALRGKNLACWCKPGDPCHADVLLEIANG